MIITKNNIKHLVDKETGEMVPVDSSMNIIVDQKDLRAKKFYYLHRYREHTSSRSLRFCYVTPVSRSNNYQLAPNSKTTSLKYSEKTYKFTIGPFQPEPNKEGLTGSIQVYKTKDEGRAHISGVTKCSNVWCCPVCSARIATKRANLLKDAFEVHKENKGHFYLITLTIPHTKSDSISTLIDDLTKMYRKFTEKRSYKEFKNKELVGVVKSIEVTYGSSNGWHPHIHIIAFSKTKLTNEQLKDIYFPNWKSVVIGSGYHLKTDSRLVDIRGGSDAHAYLLKSSQAWDMADELVKGHKKKAKAEKNGNIRYSAYSLLVSFVENENYHHLKLFQEYEKAFKGKHQLQPCRSFKTAFKEVFNKTDDLLNTEFDSPSELMAGIDSETWKIVASRNLFSDLMTCAETSKNALHSFIAYVSTLEPKESFNLKRLDQLFNLSILNKSKISINDSYYKNSYNSIKIMFIYSSGCFHLLNKPLYGDIDPVLTTTQLHNIARSRLSKPVTVSHGKH